MKKFLKNYLTTIIKYLLSIVLVVYSSWFYNNVGYLLFGLFELIVVFIVSQFFLEKNKVIGNIISISLLFLFNVNYMLLIFSNSFLTLGSNLLIYIPCLAVVSIISFTPVNNINFKYKKILLLILIPYILLLVLLNNNYSVYKSCYKVVKDGVDKIVFRIKMKKYITSKRFNSHSDSDNTKYKIKGTPNVIIIFTEGLSRNIIDDDRDIMPNTRDYMNKSISFDNYYNHTAATFRGIMGQLYSGYQYENLDHNLLISMQDILRDKGYSSEFINVEYRNKEWNKYLDSLNFDEIKTITEKPYLTDEESYDLLFEEAERLNKEKKPFLLGIYTMETHTGWETKEHKYGNGKDKEINKFHNNDYHFGEFMKKYINSDLYKNTIIVYTTDHASYADWNYTVSFKNYKRDCLFLDKIPFFIYYKGVEPVKIDVNGRNSLDMTPTVLDLLDVFADNYFLGDSLFDSNNTSKFDYYFSYPGEYYSSFNSKIKNESKNKEFIQATNEYCALARR